MKFLTFIEDGRTGVGAIEGSEIIDLTGLQFADNMIELIERYDGLKERLRIIRRSGEGRRALSSVKALAPIPTPRRNIFCVGKNYREHAIEFGKSGFDGGSTGGTEVSEYPIVFSKPPSCVIGPDEEILSSLDPYSSVDYEGELAIIIGRTGLVGPSDDPMAFVFGYSVFNDITSRELQKRHKQWLLGKGIDTFGPLGPVIVTPDELEPFPSVRLRTWVNGELRQQSVLSKLIFGVDVLIRTIGRSTTLHAGDIIATGTPSGVGIGFSPPRYLSKGDRVTVEIDGIGSLSNPVA